MSASARSQSSLIAARQRSENFADYVIEQSFAPSAIETTAARNFLEVVLAPLAWLPNGKPRFALVSEHGQHLDPPRSTRAAGFAISARLHLQPLQRAGVTLSTSNHASATGTWRPLRKPCFRSSLDRSSSPKHLSRVFMHMHELMMAKLGLTRAGGWHPF